jgi:phosphate acetyltransferase
MADPIRPGARASIEHVFTTDEIAAFVTLSGDDNPIHLDARVARSAGFDREVVHGVLVTSLISRLLGTRLPGPGTILLGQELRYRRPVHPGDLVRATVEIMSVRQDKPVVTLRTWIETDDVVLDGEATVLVRRFDPGLPSDPRQETR